MGQVLRETHDDDELLNATRRSADRFLGALVALHFPLSLVIGLANGTWAIALLVGGATSWTAW